MPDNMVLSYIRQANADDAMKIANLFVAATERMIFEGIHQWNFTYPLLTHVQEDIKNGSAFVCLVDEKIAGTITLDSNQDKQYKEIHWHHHSQNVLVIHRLAVHPHFQGMGIAKNLCIFADRYGREKGFNCIRLDAYSLNPASNKLYKSTGFKKANGYCYFHKNVIPFYCYDKKII